MGVKTKTGFAATILAVLAFVLVFIAFVTPYWLESDGKHSDAKFERMGLWQVCFRGLKDIHHFYDTEFNECWWVFEEEYYIIHDLLLPGFFVATQFFFTLSFTLLLVASFMTALYLCCSRHHGHFVLLLLVTGADLILAAVSGTIAVVIFGAYGDGRDWMPNWEYNNMGWSYALAVFGVLALYGSGTLFLTEGRRHHKRKLREQEGHSAEFGMQQCKTPTHTTI